MTKNHEKLRTVHTSKQISWTKPNASLRSHR